MPRNNGNTQKKKKTNKVMNEESVKKVYKSRRETKEEKKERQRQKSYKVKATNVKQKPFFATKPEGAYGDPYEYKMTEYDANDILKTATTKEEKSMRPEQYLCNYVTEQYGLKGWCCRVIIGG